MKSILRKLICRVRIGLRFNGFFVGWRVEFRSTSSRSFRFRSSCVLLEIILSCCCSMKFFLSGSSMVSDWLQMKLSGFGQVPCRRKLFPPVRIGLQFNRIYLSVSDRFAVDVRWNFQVHIVLYKIFGQIAGHFNLDWRSTGWLQLTWKNLPDGKKIIIF